MQLPTPIPAQSHAASNQKEIETLLEINNITTLHISQSAAIQISSISQIIRKNARTLINLKIDGMVNEHVSENQSSELAAAINQCGDLKVLAIENFRVAFNKHVSHLTKCLEFLHKLEMLSFKGTYFGDEAKFIFYYLGKSSTIKTLNLESCALVTERIWGELCGWLRNNSSLLELNLGKAPIWHYPVYFLQIGLFYYKNNIHTLKWDVPSFEESETRFCNDREQTNWDNNPQITAGIEDNRAQLQHYLKTKRHHAGYERDCLAVEELKKYITDKNNPQPKNSLVFACKDDFRFRPYKMTAYIYQNRTTLQELVIQPRITEDNLSEINGQEFEDFVTALSHCTQLTTLKINGLKNVYSEDQWSVLLQAVATLPKLQYLSLSENYLGDAGAKALTTILDKDVLIELELISGLVSSTSFEQFSRALAQNTSLTQLELGNSPMMISWMNSLAKAMQARQTFAPLKMSWQNSPKNEMAQSIAMMCTSLARGDKKGYYETQRKLFFTQSSNLAAHWTAINKETTSYTKIKRGIGRTSKPVSGMEMLMLSAHSNPTENVLDCNAKTKEDLLPLLNAKNVRSITVLGQATLDYEIVIQIINNNKSTLTEISLDGSWVQFDIDKKTSEQLANAIKSCCLLEKLTIKNFNNSFKNNIVFFSSCLDLKHIRELSFQNTYLGRHSDLLFKHLANHNQLKKINLSNTALVLPSNWIALESALMKNACLEEITLGRTATRLHAVETMLNGIISSTSKVKVLNWNWLSLEAGEEFHWKSYKLVNWENDPKVNDDIEGLLKQVEKHGGTEQHLLTSAYRVAKIKFEHLMAYLADRANTEPQQDLTIEIHNEHDFDLNLLAARISLYSNSLRYLTIRMDSIEHHNPWNLHDKFEKFVQALKSCKKLKRFNFENMQGTFKNGHLTHILKALMELPDLYYLSLKKTYVGEAFIQDLANLIKQDQIQFLDLTLAGLISLRCIISLTNAISENTSLIKLILGKSPMTTLWLETLANGIRKRATKLDLEWTVSDIRVMQAQICAMVTDVVDKSYPQGTLRMLFDLFNKQTNHDIQKQWTALQQLSRPSANEESVVVLENSNEQNSSSKIVNKSSYGTMSPSSSLRPK